MQSSRRAVASQRVVAVCCSMQRLFRITLPLALVLCVACGAKTKPAEQHAEEPKIEELIAELRLNGVFDIDDVKYAILEQNGLLSVIPKAERQQPSFRDLKINAKEHGIQHIIISQGTWNEYNINLLGRSKLYFQEYLKKHHVSEKSVFLLTIDDLNHCTLILKEAE